MRIAFLGLGLLGGSVARALRERAPEPGAVQPDPVVLAAWSPNGRGPRTALEAGVIDQAAETPGDAISGADLIVLAAPPLACVDLVRRLGGDLRPALRGGATVTDVASTKGILLAAARVAGIPFVGGHPMAGRETTGFESSDAGLLAGRPWIVTEAVGEGEPGKVEWLARACGAVPVALDAARHDRLVAAVSHLPLVAAVALVESVAGVGADGEAGREDWSTARSLAASGWRDMTRLARGDVAMGAGIAATNAAALAARLRDYRDRLDEWIALLEASDAPDVGELEARLVAARARLETSP